MSEFWVLIFRFQFLVPNFWVRIFQNRKGDGRGKSWLITIIFIIVHHWLQQWCFRQKTSPKTHLPQGFLSLTRWVSPSWPLTLARPVTLYAWRVTSPFLSRSCRLLSCLSMLMLAINKVDRGTALLRTWRSTCEQATSLVWCQPGRWEACPGWWGRSSGRCPL